MALGIKIPRNALAKGKEAYQKDPNGSQNVDLEPGTYLGVVTGGRGVDTKNGAQLVFDIKVGGEVDDSIKGGKVSIWFSFDEERVIHLFRFLNKLGFDVSDLDEDTLESILDQIKEEPKVVRFKASEKDGYVNYRINKVMDDMSVEEVLGESAGSEESEESEEEKPKKKDKKVKKDEEEGESAEEEAEEEEKPKKSDKKAKKEEAEDEEAEEAEEEAAEEEEVVVKVGMKCKTKIKGEVVKVEVVAIDEDEGKVVVKSSKDGKKYRISPENLLP